MASSKKIWYSFQKGNPPDDHIDFFDTKDLSWAKELEDNFSIIKDEIDKYIIENDDSIKPYFNKSLVTKDKSWRTFAFFFWGIHVKSNIKKCPKSYKIFKRIPGIVSASVSIMEPNTRIKPHRGDTNAIMRAHLPIEIPETLPTCGIRVGETEKSWEPGKLIVFNDSNYHEAWNESDQRRYVVILDVIQEKFASKKNKVCSTVLAGLIMQAILQSVPFLKRLPKIILGTMLYTISGIVRLILKLKN